MNIFILNFINVYKMNLVCYYIYNKKYIYIDFIIN